MVFRIGAARGKLSLAHPQPSRIAKQQRESASVAENNHWKICRYAYRSTAAHIRTKCHQRIRHRSSEPPHNASAELPVLRLSDKQGKRNHNRFMKRSRRSDLPGYSLYHAQHVCRTSGNVARRNEWTGRWRSVRTRSGYGYADERRMEKRRTSRTLGWSNSRTNRTDFNK